MVGLLWAFSARSGLGDARFDVSNSHSSVIVKLWRGSLLLEERIYWYYEGWTSWAFSARSGPPDACLDVTNSSFLRTSTSYVRTRFARAVIAQPSW